MLGSSSCSIETSQTPLCHSLRHQLPPGHWQPHLDYPDWSRLLSFAWGWSKCQIHSQHLAMSACCTSPPSSSLGSMCSVLDQRQLVGGHGRGRGCCNDSHPFYCYYCYYYYNNTVLSRDGTQCLSHVRQPFYHWSISRTHLLHNKMFIVIFWAGLKIHILWRSRFH